MLTMAGSKIPRVESGDPITATLWNEITDRLERFANLSSASPYIRVYDSPLGKCLSLAFPEPTYARLSGSTSPYSWVEVRDGPTGSWVDLPNGDSGTSDAYECNAKSGLDGKVVQIHWSAAQDWRFQWVGFGCQWTFNMTGCGGTAVLGSTVSVKQSGVEIASCTSAGSSCTLDAPPGSYDVTVTPPAGSGYGTYTATISHTCSQTTNVSLSADSESQCSDCGPCAIMPKSIAITFNNNPLPCFQYPDLTLEFAPTWPVQPAWISTTTFLDGSGNVSRLLMVCNPGTSRYELRIIRESGESSPAGSAGFSGIDCDPFAITNGIIGFDGTCGTWTAIGL